MGSSATPSSFPTAQDEVLHTVELLEHILRSLPIKDILSSERVSRLWRNIAEKSPSVRKQKYLQPRPQRNIETNPLFLQRFVQQAALFALRAVNPSVEFLGSDPLVRGRVEAFADKNASWGRMLLFQPPRTRARLCPLSARFEDDGYPIANADGLRMGDVVAFFERSALTGTPVTVHILRETVIRRIMWILTPDQS